MVAWRKALLVGLMALVATAPVLATTGPTPLTLGGQASVPVPKGRLVTDEELLAEGEFWWFLIGMIAFGGGRAVYENWFDEDYGIDKDDLKEIAISGFGGGIGGACYGTVAAIAAYLPE
jgi:hypothetical protein